MNPQRTATKPSFGTTKAARTLISLVAFATLAFACKAKEGGKCKIENQEQCVDKASALLCQGGMWKVAQCRGPKGCATLGTETDCDQTAARVGEVCDAPNHIVCSDDKKNSLFCKDGEWQLDEVCSGPKGCSVSAGRTECDNSVAKEGDKCVRETTVCTQDKRNRLACKGGKFVLVENCRGPSGCRYVGTKVDSCVQPRRQSDSHLQGRQVRARRSL
jgi:hypothetical protein